MYDYRALITEVLDLQTELFARQADTIPGEVGPVIFPPAEFARENKIARPVPAYAGRKRSPGDRGRALAQVESARRRPGDTVRVVFHQSDVSTSGALARLTGLGFVIEQGAEGPNDRPSLAITVGSRVSNADVRLVALALIASGLDPKRIRRSADPKLARSIEVEYRQSLLDWPGLTVDDVNRITS
jgi:hypothetical protein